MRQGLLLLTLLVPTIAAAKQKVVLSADKPLEGLIEKAIKSKYTVKNASLSAEPTSGDVKTACREAGGAIAVVTAREGHGDNWTVMVLNGADGTPLTSFRLKVGKKAPKTLPHPDVKKLLDALDDAKPPKKEKEDVSKAPPPEEKAAPEEKPAPEEKEEVAERPAPEERRRGKPSEPPAPPAEEVRAREDEEEPAPRGAARKLPAVKIGVGFKLFSRQFGYTDDIFDQLSTYYLPRGPAIGAELELWPAAFITSGFAGNIGLLGSFDYAVGIASKAEDGTRYSTTAMNLRVSLAVRIPAGPLIAQPFVGYGLQTYGISASNGTKPNIPSVSYGALRPGLMLKLKVFGPLALQAYFAYQAVLSTGEITTYFPKLKASGFDAGGALSLTLMDRIELKVGYEYQLFWFSMNPVPGDMNVAGGALDRYISGNASIAFVF